MIGRRESIDGYLLGDAYPSNFHRQFAPAWIDSVLRHKGYRPPRTARGHFHLLDLGCGDGMGLLLLAAAYPEGEFLGIDALPSHIAAAAETAARLKLANVRFDCARFADVARPAAADFDYVTGQGLLAWISEENREHAYRIAREHLRPEGIACFGYNSLPAWKDIAPFQRLVRMLAEARDGTMSERFAQSLEQVRAISAAGAHSIPEWVMGWVDALIHQLPDAYFPHEYLNENWTPLWSADVVANLARHGFIYLAQGREDRLRDGFCLRAKQRDELARIKDPLTRELAADIFIDCSFRIDIYARGALLADDCEQDRLEGWWAGTVAGRDAAYFCQTPAGTLRFDNRAAHSILRKLELGPATLRSIHRTGGAGTVADVLNASDALLVAGHIVPVDPPARPPAASAMNSEILRRAHAGSYLKALIGDHGPVPIAAGEFEAFAATEKSARSTAALQRIGVAAFG